MRTWEDVNCKLIVNKELIAPDGKGARLSDIEQMKTDDSLPAPWSQAPRGETPPQSQQKP